MLPTVVFLKVSKSPQVRVLPVKMNGILVRAEELRVLTIWALLKKSCGYAEDGLLALAKTILRSAHLDLEAKHCHSSLSSTPMVRTLISLEGLVMGQDEATPMGLPYGFAYFKEGSYFSPARQKIEWVTRLPRRRQWRGGVVVLQKCWWSLEKYWEALTTWIRF